MKYIVRAIKYFLYYVLIMVILMAILVAFKIVPSDISQMFRNGYDSLWQIAIMFAFVAAFYPMFGFMKKDAIVPGEYSEVREGILDYMASKGYKVEKEEGENISFILKSPVTRFSRVFFEDRITMTRQLGGFQVEGLRRDVVRIVYGIESKFRKEE